ncbi:MAG TPA: hypothetical protein VGI75_04195 [Pirellulales bacterium]
MSEVDAFLRRVIALLNTAKIPYMVVGSFASGIHGHFRSTHDLDIVIDANSGQLQDFVRFAAADFYADAHAANEALARRSMFNIIDFSSGYKADLIFRKLRKFSESEFGRKQIARLVEMDIWLASAEDTILSKLEWAKLGQSERQYQDAFHIATMKGAELDSAYLRRWAVELDVADLLEKLLTEASL